MQMVSLATKWLLLFGATLCVFGMRLHANAQTRSDI